MYVTVQFDVLLISTQLASVAYQIFRNAVPNRIESLASGLSGQVPLSSVEGFASPAASAAANSTGNPIAG